MAMLDNTLVPLGLRASLQPQDLWPLTGQVRIVPIFGEEINRGSKPGPADIEIKPTFLATPFGRVPRYFFYEAAWCQAPFFILDEQRFSSFTGQSN